VHAAAGQFSELQAALGPPSVSLLVGAFVFGLAMQIADGCGSGTLYKAGLGVPLNMGILPLFALGSFLGSVHLDRWLALGQMPPVGLVSHLGRRAARWPARWLALLVVAWVCAGSGLGFKAWIAAAGSGVRWRWRCWRR
jgi:hypothetical protein